MPVAMKPDWIKVVHHVRYLAIARSVTGEVQDATEVYDDAMEAVRAGYLTVSQHAQFRVTDKGRELLKNGES